MVPEYGASKGCPSLLSVAVIKKKKTNILIKTQLGKKGFVWLMLLDHNPSLRKEKIQDRSLEAGTMEEWCLQDCSISSYLASFCIQPKDYLSRDGPVQGELGPPMWIINQSLINIATGLSSTEALSSHLTLDYAKLTIKTGGDEVMRVDAYDGKNICIRLFFLIRAKYPRLKTYL